MPPPASTAPSATEGASTMSSPSASDPHAVSSSGADSHPLQLSYLLHQLASWRAPLNEHFHRADIYTEAYTFCVCRGYPSQARACARAPSFRGGSVQRGECAPGSRGLLRSFGARACCAWPARAVVVAERCPEERPVCPPGAQHAHAPSVPRPDHGGARLGLTRGMPAMHSHSSFRSFAACGPYLPNLCMASVFSSRTV